MDDVRPFLFLICYGGIAVLILSMLEAYFCLGLEGPPPSKGKYVVWVAVLALSVWAGYLLF